MEWSGTGPSTGAEGVLSEIGGAVLGGVGLLGILVFVGGLLAALRAGDGNKDGKSGWGKALIMMLIGVGLVAVGGGSVFGGQ